MPLTQRAIGKITEPGKYPDKHGLTLIVNPGGSKSWIFRYQLDDARHDVGLGVFPLVSLADARKAVLEMRLKIQNGVDPLAEKRQKSTRPTGTVTFENEALALVERFKHGWSAKHTEQWLNSFRDHVFPVIGQRPINEIDTTVVHAVLSPIWLDKPETARRIRNRLERVLDFAKVRGNREGENPARWRGHLQNVLSNVMDASIPLESMPYYALPEFIGRLEGDTTRPARCLQFLILTAARTGEAMGAKWDEIDFAAKVWTIPAERMKNSEPHQIPLSDQALAVLKDVQTRGRSNFIFPNRMLNKPMANNALRRLLEKYNAACTVHGFRSTFRMWAAEKTDFAHDLCETALSHTVGNATSRAYNRGNQLEKRRPLMMKWADYATNRIAPPRQLIARAAATPRASLRN